MKVLSVLVVMSLPCACFAGESGSVSAAAANVPAQVHTSTFTYKLPNGPSLIMKYVPAAPVSSSATVVSTAAVTADSGAAKARRKAGPAKIPGGKKAVKK